MKWLQSLFQRSTPPGPRDGDIIYPVHFLDNEPNLRTTVLTWTMRFNDVLDHDMLHAAFVKLMETGDWRKLGGRLAEKDNKFYLYSPASFTPERPAVNFTHEKFDISIHEHPMGKLIPGKGSGQPSIYTNMKRFFEPFARPQGAPDSINEYLTREMPVLSMHIVSFEDATLVSITFPHCILDAMSLKCVMVAWTAVLSGKDEIPALLGANEDVLVNFSEKVYGRRNYILQSLRLTGVWFWMFLMRFIFDIVFGPAIESFLVALPKDAVERLRKEVEADLGSLHVESQDTDDDSPGGVQKSISRGDILYSWFIHHVIAALPSPRPVICTVAVSLRKRLPGIDEPGSSSLYVQNLILLANMSASALEATKASIGEIARRLRRSLIAQATTDQLIACLQTMQREEEQTGRYPIVLAGEPSSLHIQSSNWSIADFCGVVDFGPAVIRPGDGPSLRSNPPGTIFRHYMGFMKIPGMIRNVVCILGTDHEGTYWLTGWSDARVISKVEESIRKMSS